MRVSIFLPMRAGSQRVKKKNTRPFLESGESLFECKIKEIKKLVDLGVADEIVVSTNDPQVITQAQPFLSKKIRIDERPDELCSSSTKVADLINYVPSVVEGDHVFWMHVTSPFMGGDDYKNAVNLYFKNVIHGDHDSLMSVNKIQQFLWSDKLKKVINTDRSANPWPNTQDLDPLYEINHSFYISSIENYLELEDRIGVNPFLYECEGLKKLDIDWEEDFSLAKMIARSMFTEQ